MVAGYVVFSFSQGTFHAYGAAACRAARCWHWRSRVAGSRSSPARRRTRSPPWDMAKRAATRPRVPRAWRVRLRRRLRRRGPRRLRPLRRYAWHERRRRRRGLRRRARARVCRRSGGRIPLAERSGECGARGLHGRRPAPDRRAARVTRTLGSAPLRARGRPRRRWVRCWWRWRLRWWRWPRLGRERRAHPMGRVPLPDGHRPRREHQRLLASTCAREPTPRDRPFELWLAPR